MILYVYALIVVLVQTEVNHESNTRSSEIVCTQSEKENPNAVDPILVETCTWRQYKTVSTGSPDYKGRYSYKIVLYENKGGEDREIKNTDLFNDRVKDFEVILNKRIKGEFKEYIAEEELNKSFKDYELPYYSVNDVQISFEERGVLLFQARTGLGGAYVNLSTVFVSYKPEAIKEFLK